GQVYPRLRVGLRWFSYRNPGLGLAGSVWTRNGPVSRRGRSTGPRVRLRPTSLPAARGRRLGVLDVDVVLLDQLAELGRELGVAALLDLVAVLLAELDEGAVAGRAGAGRARVLELLAAHRVTFTHPHVHPLLGGAHAHAPLAHPHTHSHAHSL